MSNSNPKTLMGQLKIPMISVIPAASLIHQAHAMRYGAYGAQRADGTRGYGPYNWRDQPIEASVYIDAAMRHILQWFDGEENADDSQAHHLAHALATIGILLDAMENNTMIDDRPRVRSGVASALFARLKNIRGRDVEKPAPLRAAPQECRSPYCECDPGKCRGGWKDMRSVPKRTLEDAYSEPLTPGAVEAGKAFVEACRDAAEPAPFTPACDTTSGPCRCGGCH